MKAHSYTFLFSFSSFGYKYKPTEATEKKKIIHIFDVSTVMDVWMLRCVNFNPSFSYPLPARQVLWYWKSDKIHAKISLIWIKLVSFEDILMAHIVYSFYFKVGCGSFFFLIFGRKLHDDLDHWVFVYLKAPHDS